MRHEIVTDVHGQKLFDNQSRVKAWLPAHLGVEVIEAEQRPFPAGTWTKVRTPAGRVGWVDADHVMRVE
jgi:hypothetical protein